MPTEQTLSLIKPDGVARGLIGEVIGRFEKADLKIRALKMLQLSRFEFAGASHEKITPGNFRGSLFRDGVSIDSWR